MCQVGGGTKGIHSILVSEKPQTKATDIFGCALELQWAVFLMFLAEVTWFKICFSHESHILICYKNNKNLSKNSSRRYVF